MRESAEQIRRKEKRFAVLNKRNGRCAYCGVCLKNEVWQIDHIYPKKRYKIRIWDEDFIQGSDDISNLFPCCQSCNSSKCDLDLERFRVRIQNRLNDLNANYSVYRMAKRFGLVTENKTHIVFYFETLTNNV